MQNEHPFRKFVKDFYTNLKQIKQKGVLNEYFKSKYKNRF